MSKLCVGLAIALTWLALLSCQPEPTALIGQDYQSWPRTSQVILNYPIPGHMDKLRQIFIEPRANGVIISQPAGKRHFEYPVGTVVIKEIYATANPGAGEKPVQLTGMVKAPADPRSRGGWLWVMKDLKTSSEQVVSQELCFTCHANANEAHPYGDRNPKGEFRDYLFFPWDPANPPVETY